MEVLHHITPYFGGISPYIALTLVPEMAIDYIYLVGGFNHLEKYESQWEG